MSNNIRLMNRVRHFRHSSGMIKIFRKHISVSALTTSQMSNNIRLMNRVRHFRHSSGMIKIFRKHISVSALTTSKFELYLTIS